jgi:hypothetical protein
MLDPDLIESIDYKNPALWNTYQPKNIQSQLTLQAVLSQP